MRIGIDARKLGGRNQGIGRYTEMLLKHMSEIDHDNEFYIFISQETPRPQLPSNFHLIPVKISWYGWREQLSWPFLLRSYKLDVMHFVHFNVPLLYRGNFVVTIHDLILFHFKSGHVTTRSYLYFLFKYQLFRIVFRSAVHRARKIIAISQFTKKDLVSRIPLAASKTVVIYEGVPRAVVNSHDDHAVKINNTIPEHFILYVGNAYPHKNLEFLIRSFFYWHKTHSEYSLIFVGRIDSFYERLKQIVRAEKIQGIIFLGDVSDEMLEMLYQRSAAYVFPTLLEGFGLPPLEAMSRGVPVLASNAGSVPEILGDAALYFDPKNSHDFNEKLSQIVSQKDVQESLRKKGFSQIKRYSWSEMAVKTHELYV